MSYRGDKIAGSILKHMAGPHLEGIADTLLKRRLGEKHFEAAKSFIQATLDAAEEKIQWKLQDTADTHLNIALRQRRLNFFLMYMAVNANDYSEYMPAVNKILISQTSALFFDRFLPLRLYAPHLEFRHIQRSTKALDYRDDPFKFALAFSLLLSKALEDQMPEEPGKTVPVVIPQPNGLFLGSARKVHPASYLHANCLYIIHNEQEGKGTRSTTIPEWLPTVEITFKTYIHSRDFFGSQRMLHQALSPFMEDPDKVAAMARFIDGYVIGQLETMLSPFEKKNLELTLRELVEVTQGREWEIAVKRTAPAIAKKDLQ